MFLLLTLFCYNFSAKIVIFLTLVNSVICHSASEKNKQKITHECKSFFSYKVQCYYSF